MGDGTAADLLAAPASPASGGRPSATIQQQQQHRRFSVRRRMRVVGLVVLLSVGSAMIMLWWGTNRIFPSMAFDQQEIQSFTASVMQFVGTPLSSQEVALSSSSSRAAQSQPPPSQGISSGASSSGGGKSPSNDKKWAYAFLMAGCQPESPTYLGYLYDILISAYRLRKAGSVADFVAMVQMSSQTNATKLPEPHEAFLRRLGIVVVYMPKHRIKRPPPATATNGSSGTEAAAELDEDELLYLPENFYSIIMSKFYTLSLTNYRRVIFLDSDVIPYCNLDYVFQLVEDGYLKSNVIIATRGSPVNAGFWLVSPEKDDYRQAGRIISNFFHTIRSDSKSPSKDPSKKDFPEDTGWGQAILPPDSARMGKRKWSQLWRWHGVVGDQGFLYYWVKYFKRDVSIFIEHILENWIAADDNYDSNNHTSGTGNTTVVRLEKTIPNVPEQLANVTCLAPELTSKGHYGEILRVRDKFYESLPPFRDFCHFVGPVKPWNHFIDSAWTNHTGNITHFTNKSEYEVATPGELWYHSLGKLNEQYSLGIDLFRVRMGRGNIDRHIQPSALTQSLGIK